MVTVSALLLLVVLGAPPGTPDDVGAPGDGLGLATNGSTPSPAPSSTLPAIPTPALGLGALAAIAGLAAMRGAPGGRTGADRKAKMSEERPVLIHLDGSGDGEIAFRIGPADADHVAIYVPGTGADLTSALDTGLERARNIRAAAQLADPTATVAVIYALPFDAPDHVAWHPLSADCACNPELADVGAQRLTEFVAAQDLGDTDVTIIGYSYGSTVVGDALADEGLAPLVDRVVLVGSPGAGVDNVADLNMPDGAVYATRAEGDIIHLAPGLKPIGVGLATPGLLGFWPGVLWSLGDRVLNDRLIHGTDPAGDEFGATAFASGDFGHGDYFDSVDHLDGIGRAVVGNAP